MRAAQAGGCPEDVATVWEMRGRERRGGEVEGRRKAESCAGGGRNVGGDDDNDDDDEDGEGERFSGRVWLQLEVVEMEEMGARLQLDFLQRDPACFCRSPKRACSTLPSTALLLATQSIKLVRSIYIRQ